MAMLGRYNRIRAPNGDQVLHDDEIEHRCNEARVLHDIALFWTNPEMLAYCGMHTVRSINA